MHLWVDVLIYILQWFHIFTAFLKEFFASLLLLLRDTPHFFSIFVKKTSLWKPSICDVVHSDVQVRMRDSKTRQNFMQEKVENSTD